MSVRDILQAAAGVSGGEPTDPNFNQTVLLLHGDGNQGANNFSNAGPTRYLAFSDNSNNNFPITVQGDAYGTNISPYQGNYSALFDGSGDTLTIPSPTAGLSFGTGEFTIEFWVYKTVARNEVILDARSAPTASPWVVAIDANNYPYFYDGSSYTSTTLISLNAWNHVTVVRTSGVLKIFVNGVQGYSASYNVNLDRTAGLVIGDTVHAAGPLTAYLSNIRIVKGTAVYTSAFTPPTAPLTAISGTSLLTCQSNRFIDNSTNNFAITRVGDTRISPFQPFTLAANDNGSGIFDGTDCLNTSLITFTGDFTWECWYYPTALGSGVSTNYSILMGELVVDNIQFYVTTNGTIQYYAAPSNRITSAAELVRVNTWTHIALVRSGSTTTLYVNGVSAGSASDAGTRYIAAVGGILPFNANFGVRGYLSNVRLVSSAVYTGNFTPPTSPLTNVTNTQLLTCQYSGTVRNVGFIDSSPYDFPITRVGNTTQGTFSPFSVGAGEFSNFFDGTGDSLQIANNAAFNLGTGDFTIECWVYLTGDTAQNSGGNRPANLVTTVPTTGTVNGYAFYISGNSSTTGTGFLFENTVSNINYSVTYTGTLAKFTWHHLAVARLGTTTKLYLNGAEVASGTLGNQTVSNSTNATGIGASFYTGYTNNIPGYMSNVRVVKGRAVYTSAFTPSTVPLGATSGGQNPPQGTETSLLTCQSNRFVDNSTNAFAITRFGDVRVTPFSPFAPSAAYDPAVNGGSGYFDGSGDMLSTPTDAAFLYGTGDFTYEFWVYHTSLSGQQTYFSRATSGSFNGVYIYKDTSNFVGVYYTSQIATSSIAITAGQWYHIVVSRLSGTLRIFIDGVQRASVANSTNLTESIVRLGADGSNVLHPFFGYMSGVRILKGTGYSSISVPTAPLTPITNTSLLLNFANAGIYDQTGKNVLETVGNAQVDTNIKKYGLGSMKFDGTGDYLKLPSSVDLALGAGDFTIEFWINLTVRTSFGTVFTSGSESSAVFASFDTNGNFLRLSSLNTVFAVSPTIALGTWTHVALVRSAGSSVVYTNGVAGTAVACTFTFTQSAPVVGATAAFANLLNGYIDDLRITKGVARYTANFTPPAQAFPNL
jgi:hypothetical protein